MKGQNNRCREPNLRLISWCGMLKCSLLCSVAKSDFNENGTLLFLSSTNFSSHRARQFNSKHCLKIRHQIIRTVLKKKKHLMRKKPMVCAELRSLFITGFLRFFSVSPRFGSVQNLENSFQFPPACIVTSC